MKKKKNQKNKSFKATIKKLLVKLKPYLLPIVIAVVLALIGSILTLVGPDKLSEITDTIVKALPKYNAETNVWSNIGAVLDNEKIQHLAIFLLVIYSVSFAFSYAQGIIMNIVTQKFSKKLREKISKKINLMPLSYLDKNAYGDVLSRVTNDVDNVSQTLSNSVVTLVSSLALLVGAIIMMFVTNYILALSAIFASLFGFVIMAVIMSKSQKYFVKRQKALGELNGHIEEVYSGHNVVKAYNAEEKMLKEFKVINKKLYFNGWKSQFLSGLMMPLMGFIGNFGYVIVCVVGALLAHAGMISFGVIVAFMVYVRLFTQPLSQLAQVANSFQTTAAASDRIFDFLEQPELEKEDDKTFYINKIKGNVEFNNVNFAYDKNVPIIKNFTAKIKAGQKVAIVGPTGAGKTTLVNLLMRFYEINEGQIKIDGVNIKDITRQNLHDLFSMVLQDTWIFEASVKDNVRYTLKDATDDDVINACKEVGLDHFIKTLPKGYDTVLNESVSISSGQKQLITIARAILQNSPMLILDEATSNVDTRTEILIQQAMDKLTRNRTSFIIAHRLSTIKNADVILVINEGDIIEQGNHEELLAKNGFYAKLYNSQF